MGDGGTGGDAPADMMDPDIPLPNVLLRHASRPDCGHGGVVECVAEPSGCLTRLTQPCRLGSACDPVTLTSTDSGCFGKADCTVGDRVCGGDYRYFECALDAEGCHYEHEVACDDGTSVDGGSGATWGYDPCAGTEGCRSEEAFCDDGGFTNSALRGGTIPAGEVRLVAVSTFSRAAVGDYGITGTSLHALVQSELVRPTRQPTTSTRPNSWSAAVA